MQTTPDAECPSLAGSHEVDVAILGGGLTGLHAALKILEDNPAKRVVLVEADQICSDASGRTMGKVTLSHSDVFNQLSPDKGELYVAANKEGFDRILHLIKTYAIECDLERAANYLFASTEPCIKHVREDFESMRRSRLAVEWIEPRNEESREIRLDFLAGIRQPDQAVYHPRKFALGLLHAINALGGLVYEHTIATKLEEHDSSVTIWLDGGGQLEAKKALVATRLGLDVDEPFADSLQIWRDHLAAYLFDNKPLVNAYIRYEPSIESLRAHRDYLLLGGKDPQALPFEDEKHFYALDTWERQAYAEQNTVAEEQSDGTGQDATRAESRSEGAGHTALEVGVGQRTATWWGEDCDSKDMLPLIGPYRKGSQHTFMATGYCGWGMTKAAFAGIMLADLVAGRTSPYQDCFDPWRF